MSEITRNPIRNTAVAAYRHVTKPTSKDFQEAENECVAVILNGIPDEGGAADKKTFEDIIRTAFNGGVTAALRKGN